MELLFNPCGEFRWSPEGPVSQIHTPHLRVGAPGIFSDLLRSVQMLKRACLFGKITKDLIGQQKTNNTSHLTVGGILNRHSHWHSYLCTDHVTRSDVQLHEATFQYHTNIRNQRSAATKQVRKVYAQTLFSLWMVFICHIFTLLHEIRGPSRK